VPVHHTNEIAQSEAASGQEFVKYWLHNEHLTVDGAKMSKSGGTAHSLADLKAKGFDVDKKMIEAGHIKEIGEHELVISLSHGLEARITLVVNEETA